MLALIWVSTILPCCLASAEYGQTMEHSKSKKIQPISRADGTPCTNVIRSCSSSGYWMLFVYIPNISFISTNKPEGSWSMIEYDGWEKDNPKGSAVRPLFQSARHQLTDTLLEQLGVHFNANEVRRSRPSYSPMALPDTDPNSPSITFHEVILHNTSK